MENLHDLILILHNVVLVRNILLAPFLLLHEKDMCLYFSYDTKEGVHVHD